MNFYRKKKRNELKRVKKKKYFFLLHMDMRGMHQCDVNNTSKHDYTVRVCSLALVQIALLHIAPYSNRISNLVFIASFLLGERKKKNYALKIHFSFLCRNIRRSDINFKVQ